MSSRGKGEDFETKIEGDRSKRFEYLLKQTEIFSHFMTSSAKNSTSPATKSKAGRPAKKPKEVDPKDDPKEPPIIAGSAAE